MKQPKTTKDECVGQHDFRIEQWSIDSFGDETNHLAAVICRKCGEVKIVKVKKE